MSRPCVWVVVLGDFGRSPRMQYHALSLADQVIGTERLRGERAREGNKEVERGKVDRWRVFFEKKKKRKLSLFASLFLTSGA